GTITTSSVTSSGLTLSWTKATDTVSPQSTLLYEVRQSTSNNISSVGTAEGSGTIALAYTADIAGTNITGLSASTPYFFNVIVKDQAGNKAIFTTVPVTTLASTDTTPPTPGNSGTITTSAVTST